MIKNPGILTQRDFNISSNSHWWRYTEVHVVRLTREEVPVAVGFILALLTVGHGRHLLGRGAAHLLLLSCSPPHPWAVQAHLGGTDTREWQVTSWQTYFVNPFEPKSHNSLQASWWMFCLWGNHLRSLSLLETPRGERRPCNYPNQTS